jgi:tetratricopeptide (TPR) repeat protein
LAEATPEDEQIAADLARTRHNLAVLLKKMSAFWEAETLFNLARSAREEIVRRTPDNLEARSELASSTYQLGTVLAHLVGRSQEARDLYESSISMQREVVDERNDLESERRELARYLNNLALLLQGTEPGMADRAFEESTLLQRRLVEENSDVPHYRRELARTLNNRVRGDITRTPDLAAPPLREAIALAKQLTVDFPTVPEYWSELGGYLSNLGLSLSEQGRLMDDQAAATEAEELFRQAEEAFRRSVSIRADLVERYPLRPEFRHRLSLTQHNLARFIRGRNQLEEAGSTLESAVNGLRSLVNDHPGVPEYQKDLALAISEQAYTSLVMGEEAPRIMDLAEEGLRLAEVAAKDRPNDQVYLDALRNMHLQLAGLNRDLRRYRDAAVHADFVGEHAQEDPKWYYFAAELYLHLSKLAAEDERLSPEERSKLRDEYFEGAISWLARSAEAGFQTIRDVEDQFGPYADRDEVGKALDRIRENASKSR